MNNRCQLFDVRFPVPHDSLHLSRSCRMATSYIRVVWRGIAATLGIKPPTLSPHAFDGGGVLAVRYPRCAR